MKKIAIHGVPRSGTSWLGSIFDSSKETVYKLQPLFSYAFKGYLNEKSHREEIDRFFSLIKDTNDEFINQLERKKMGKYPIFVKYKNPSVVVYKEARYHYILENMLQQCEDIKIIGIIRNPLGVINSFLKAPKEFREDLGWLELEEWKYASKKNEGRQENYYGFEKWKEVAWLFLKLRKSYPKNFRLVKYEDIEENTLQVVSDIFSFCGLALEEQTTEFLNNSKSTNSDDPYGVFRAKHKHSTWESSLNPTIKEAILNDVDFLEINKIIGWDL